MSQPEGSASPLRRRRRQIALGVAVGAAALAGALWGVPLGDVGAALADAEVIWLLPVAGLFLIQQTLRAWRQALMIQATHPEHTLRTSLSVLCIGFFCINVLPARLGELVRPLLLLEREGIPIGAGFGMVFVERALDLCSMLVMLGLVAWLVPVPGRTLEIAGQSVDWVNLGRIAAGIAAPSVLAGGVLVAVAGRPILARLKGDGLVVRLIQRFGQGFLGLLEGALRSPGRLAAILGLTVVTWVLTGAMYPPLARAFGIGDAIGYGEGVGVLAMTMAGMALPAAPGFAGTYEAAVRAGLALFGVAGEGADGRSLDAIAVAYALTMHWWIHAVQSMTAVVFMALDGFSPKKMWQGIVEELGGEAQDSSR